MCPSSLHIKDLGYSPGSLPTGPTNSILDVPGVHVSQITVPTSPNLKAGSTATKGFSKFLAYNQTLRYYKDYDETSETEMGYMLTLGQL